LVKEEIKETSMSAVRFTTAVESGKLKIKMPSETFLTKVKASATLVGDVSFLSETDIHILALALQLKTQGYNPQIITDDYSIQNVATQMNVEFASLTTAGIRRRLQWIRYCPACHRRYTPDSPKKTCETCGTSLKRKPVRNGNF